jgi:RND family efflux transporter MFP subunit
MIRILIAIVPLLLVASCARNGGAAAVSAPVETPRVAVGKVTRTDLSSDLALTAEFEPFQEVDLMAKVSGYIRQIKVDIGDRVREGQVLTVLEIPEMQDDLTRAAASIEEAQAELATARDDLQRAQSAHEAAHLSYARVLDVSRREPGLVPQQEVDEVHSRDLVAEAQISAARSHVSACEQRIHVTQADQARLKTLLQYATITAPFAGVVTRRYANTGSLVQAGTSSQATPVVRLSENGLLRLDLPVPESAVPQVHLGESVEVRVPALDRSFPGKVARFADKVDEATRTMKTEVDVPNADLVLIPGMYAEVDLITEKRRAALAVPVEAVDVASGSARVLAVTPSGAIRIIPIVTGIETAQQIEVRSGDLKEGDRVVIGSRAGLKDGDQVRAKF